MALTKAKLIADGVIVVGNLHSSHGITSANIGENTNLYFTNARARSAISVSGNALSYNSSTGVITSNFEESPTFTGDITGAQNFKASGNNMKLFAGGTHVINIDLNKNFYPQTHNDTDIGFSSTLAFRNYYSSGTIYANNISATGNVGIGTTSPNAKLEIRNDVAASTDLDPTSIKLYNNSDGGSAIEFSNAVSGNSKISFGVESTGAGTDDTFLGFSTSVNTTMSEKMRLTSAGNLGIGTISPLGILQLNVDSDHSIMRITAGDSSIAGIDFGKTSDIDDARIRYYNSTRYMEFFVANGERMRIDSSGNIGIATTSPSEKLHVVGNAYISGVGNKLLFDTTGALGSNGIKTINDYETVIFNDRGSAGFAVIGNSNIRLGFGTNYTNAETDLFISSAGNVGIGTNNPQSKLHISTAATNAPIRLQNDNGSGSTANFVLQTDSSGLGNNGFGIYDVANSAYRLVINGSGNIGIGTSSPNAFSNQTSLTINGTNNGRLDLKVGNAQKGAVIASANEMILDAGASPMQFYTGSTLHMLINTSGNVGIGTTSPSTPLTIERATNSNEPSLYIDTAGGGAGSVGIGNTSAIGPFLMGNTNPDGTVRGAYGGSRMLFNAGGFSFQYSDETSGARTFDTQMVINNSGNVGIGTTSPMTTLHVQQSDGSYPDDANNHLVVESSSHSYIGLGGGTSSDVGIHFGDSGSINQGRIAYQNSDDSLNFSTFQNVRMKISSAGNVGIGTTSPGQKLTVNGDGRFLSNSNSRVLYLKQQSNDNGNIIQFENQAGTNVWELVGRNNQFYIFNNALSSHAFFINPGTNNIGIGTTSPSAKLDIVGPSSTPLVLELNSANSNCDVTMQSANTSSVTRLRNGTNDFQVHTNGSERMRITSVGNVLIGEFAANNSVSPTLNGFGFTPSGTGTVVCNFSDTNEMIVLNQRDGSGTTQFEFRNGNVERGRIEWTTSGTTYNTTSDYRLKENITNLTESLEKINQLEPKTFNFISNPDESRIGFIAHEVENIVPQAVSGVKDDIREDGTPKYQGLDHSMLVPLLVGAIKELKADNDNLRERIQTLENQ